MTPRPTPTPTATRALAGRRTLAVGTLASALVLVGCGTQEALVGLRAAPTEQTAAAPLDVEGATAIATRLLTAADAPTEGDATAAATARGAVLMGDALTVASARAASKLATQAAPTELVAAPQPTVVAQSQGRDWPRAILATTLDVKTNTQFLHVMLSQKPDQPFRITASVSMFAGAELPALGDATKGTPLLDTGAKNDLAHVPEEAVTAYARALATPKPKATDAVVMDDPFATALRASASAQAKKFGKLATLAQVHEPLLADAVTFRLADGGAVTFGLLRRVDTISVKPGGLEVQLPAEYATITGKKSAKTSFTLQNLQPFAMVVPVTGKAKVIGATELLTSGKAR